MSSHSLRNVRNQAHLESAYGARVVGDRLSPAISWLLVGLVALGSIRGIIVLNTNLDSGTVYQSVSGMLLVVSAAGFLMSYLYPSLALGQLKTLAYINLILGILNGVIAHLVLGLPLSEGMGQIYLYVAPFILFVSMKVPAHQWRIVIAVVLIAIAYSVVENFYQLLRGPEGVQRVIDYTLRLSPDAGSLSKGEGAVRYRIGGYTGSYHDSANILGMAATFFFIRSLIMRNVLDMALALFGISTMTLTQSSSNLIMCIFTILVFTLYTLVHTRAKLTILYLAMSLAGLSLLAWGSGGAMGFFLERLLNADWGGMFNQIVTIDLLPHALVGHVSALGDATGAISGDRGTGLTEVGALRILYELGIIHTTVFFLLVLYPVWRWFKIRRWCLTAVPAAAAIVFGFLSLAHYGSVFRSTSVFLFFSFGAICLSHVMNTHRPERRGV